MLERLESKQAEYENDVEAARKAYEEKVAELEKAFDEATTEEKKQFEEEITAAFSQFEDTLTLLETQYNNELGELMSSIQAKNFGLRDASMNQRSMVMTLFYDACDTMFYNSFHVCDQKELPMMSDDFSTILEALSQIAWDTLTDPDNVQPPPTNFDYISMVLVDDDKAVDYPIQTLKETGALAVNLKRYDTQQSLDRFWRIRLKDIRFTLLQSDGTPLPSPGVNNGDEIQVHVVYPTVFNNTNGDHEKFKFVAQELHCNSDYVTDRGK